MAMSSPKSSPPIPSSPSRLRGDAPEFIPFRAPQPRSHPAIIQSHYGRLEININFVPHSPNTIMICTGADWEIDPTVLNDILSQHTYTISHIVITITFQDSRNESLQQKNDQSELIRAVAKQINHFPYIQSLYVRFILPTEKFSQQKNAAYFFQLDFLEWTLWQKVGDEEGFMRIDYRNRLGRDLAKDLAKYSNHLEAAELM